VTVRYCQPLKLSLRTNEFVFISPSISDLTTNGCSRTLYSILQPTPDLCKRLQHDPAHPPINNIRQNPSEHFRILIYRLGRVSLYRLQHLSSLTKEDPRRVSHKSPDQAVFRRFIVNDIELRNNFALCESGWGDVGLDYADRSFHWFPERLRGARGDERLVSSSYKLVLSPSANAN